MHILTAAAPNRRIIQSMSLKNFRFVAAWLPLAAAVTVLSFTVYAVVQQGQRLSANEPLVEIAESTANQLQQGASPQSVTAGSLVDVSNDLAPGVAVLDETGKVLSSSMRINSDTNRPEDGIIPQLPTGVIQSVKDRGEDRFTWEPSGGVRLAAVVTSTGGSHPEFVVAARSLREVEKRENHTLHLATAGWLLALAASFVCAWAAAKFSLKSKSSRSTI